MKERKINIVRKTWIDSSGYSFKELTPDCPLCMTGESIASINDSPFYQCLQCKRYFDVKISLWELTIKEAADYTTYSVAGGKLISEVKKAIKETDETKP